MGIIKKVVFLFLVLSLTILVGCSDKSRVITDQSSVASPEDTSTLPVETIPEYTSTLPVKTIPEYTSALQVEIIPEDSSSLPIDSNDKNTYFFSEIDKVFGPGPFSVNSLIEVFGEPIQTFGTIISVSSADIGIIVKFDNISYELVANNGENLSFDFDLLMDDIYNNGENSPPEYELSNFDKMVFIKPFQTTIKNGMLMKLPRNIEIGDSKQGVINAYDGDNGDEWEYEGQLVISYSYRPDVVERFTSDESFDLESQTGTLSYSFENDILVQVDICWYNGYLSFD